MVSEQKSVPVPAEASQGSSDEIKSLKDKLGLAGNDNTNKSSVLESDSGAKTPSSKNDESNVSQPSPNVDDTNNENGFDEPRTKESPLTDIATSPPPFDFMRERSSRMGSSSGDIGIDNPKSNKDSYESSELSDLAEDDSEAETDKMDFLEDENEDDHSSQPVSDLLALSQLTELARMKDVDSDFEDEVDKIGVIPSDKDDDTVEKNDPQKDKEQTPRPESEISHTSESSKRSADEFADESESKKQKKEPSSASEASVKNEESAIAESFEEKVKAGSDSDEDNDSTNVDISGVEGSKDAPPDKKHLTNDDAEDEDDPDREEEDEDEDEEDEEQLKSVAKSGSKMKNNAETAEVEEEEEDEEEEEEENNEEAREDSDIDDQHLNEQRKLAIEELIAIEGSFAELRDKLYHDKLSLLERELQLCLEGSHPELSKIYYKVNGFYQESLKLANFNLAYNLKCIDKETIATRTSIHQDFLKNLMDTKNEMITETTSLWYKVNRERNQLDQLVPDYNFSAIPQIPNVTVAGPQEESHSNGAVGGYDSVGEYQPLTKKTIKQNTLVELVQQHNNRNHQLGVLNGLVQFHGFPSAINTSLVATPEVSSAELLLKRATDDEILEDLKDMGIPI